MLVAVPAGCLHYMMKHATNSDSLLVFTWPLWAGATLLHPEAHLSAPWCCFPTLVGGREGHGDVMLSAEVFPILWFLLRALPEEKGEADLCR